MAYLPDEVYHTTASERLASEPPPPEHFCEAKTWSQASSGTWSGSHSSNGCQRAAKAQTPDGHWACGQHMKKPPTSESY